MNAQIEIGIKIIIFILVLILIIIEFRKKEKSVVNIIIKTIILIFLIVIIIYEIKIYNNPNQSSGIFVPITKNMKCGDTTVIYKSTSQSPLSVYVSAVSTCKDPVMVLYLDGSIVMSGDNIGIPVTVGSTGEISLECRGKEGAGCNYTISSWK